jgi:hypothetical protein
MAGFPLAMSPAAVNPFALSSKQLFPSLDRAFDVIGDDTNGAELQHRTDIELEWHSFKLPVSDEEKALLIEKERQRHLAAEAFWQQAKDEVSNRAATCSHSRTARNGLTGVSTARNAAGTACKAL